MDTSLAADRIIYPETDGKPIGETDVHVNEIVDLLKMFQQRKDAEAEVARLRGELDKLRKANGK